MVGKKDLPIEQMIAIDKIFLKEFIKKKNKLN